MRFERYQYALIVLGIVTTILLGVFLYREIFPEYMIYQNDYVALEKFRSTYTGEPPPEFKKGVKQILIEREDKGPPIIDRCTSCHVALDLPHFSPTKISRDVNGNIVRDAEGNPVQVPNENYVWAKLDEKIAQLGNSPEAEKLRALKSANVEGHIYDVTKVLSMHPLMGKETRPFEFHSMETYGCTSCHNGNGRGLTTEKAHGPVFDGQYDIEYQGPTPQFLETDVKNDPKFSRVFNNKPGHELLFQTTPIFVGALIQAKCVQCHQPTSSALQSVANSTTILTTQRTRKSKSISDALNHEKQAVVSLVNLEGIIKQQGYSKTLQLLKEKQENLALSAQEVEQASSQLEYLKTIPEKNLQLELNSQIIKSLGSEQLANQLKDLAQKEGTLTSDELAQFLQKHHTDPDASGTLFAKLDMLNVDLELMRHVEDTQDSFTQTVNDTNVITALSSDIDHLTKNYHRGEQLFISQACYACHRISGFSRGGVGPELTHAGTDYPWHLKTKIVWPQGDLKTSTMPNLHLDHAELQDLVTYLLGQTGGGLATSPTSYRINIQEWEAGRKLPWEKPIPPSKIYNLRYSMTIFATEGCAACHRLKGFESDVGYQVQKEKEKPNFDVLYAQSKWFTDLFPETIIGTDIITTIEKHADEIDQHVVNHVRKGSLLEELEQKHPEILESYYSNFRFASRAKDDLYKNDPKKLQDWQDRVHRVMMMYIQEYGLGHLIGPRPNWSGVYRSDEWLMEHFHNPSGHVPRSIMPIFPFDDSKFYALTYMLDVLGKKNRDEVHEIWQNRGFNPAQAFQIHCASCHGEYLQGNGPVSEWIYPIPKNLRNGFFLRNLTRERAIQSIQHGVLGTPMPPWGEAPQGKPTSDGIPVLRQDEIRKIVDWIFSSLPGGNVIRSTEDVPKWKYMPNDVIEELRREGHILKPGLEPESNSEANLGALFPKIEDFFVDLNPKVSNPINSIFDVVPNPFPGGEKEAYYIKKKYYTEENIQAGKAFFEINCAYCHGKEADGSGNRAEVMSDAKPRMLTNLDWLNTRDDLRLLRSIKYGVAGTAMTPWGDLTSSLQRLQLVIYIRSLTEQQEKKALLGSEVYKAFNSAESTLENSRITVYPTIEKLQNEIQEIRAQQSNYYDQLKAGKSVSDVAVQLFHKELTLAEELQKYKQADESIVNLKNLVGKDRQIFVGIGASLISSPLSDTTWNQFLKMLELKQNPFEFKNDALSFSNDPKRMKEITEIGKNIIEQINAKIASLEKEKEISEGKIPSIESSQELVEIKAQIASYTKLKGKILSGMEESTRISKQEEDVYSHLQEQLKNLQKKTTNG